MKLTKNQVNTNYIIGVEGTSEEQNLWKNFLHNYSVTGGKFHSVTDIFGYFIAPIVKFERALTEYFLCKMFLDKLYTTTELENGGGRYLSIAVARKFIKDIPNSLFYEAVCDRGDSVMEPMKVCEALGRKTFAGYSKL